MSDEMETLRLDAGGSYLWRVGDIALKTVTSVCSRCDDIHIDMSLFLGGEHDDGTPLKKTGKITIEPWSIQLDPGGGAPAETDSQLESLLDKYRDELTHRGKRMLRSRDRDQWRAEDLVGMAPGALVRYRNIFPDDFDLIFMIGDEAQFLEDYFCLVAGCPCAAVATVVTSLDDEAGNHRELGSVTFDLDEKPLKLEGKQAAVDVVRKALEDTDLFERLRARHAECRRIAPAVAKKLGIRQANVVSNRAPIKRPKVGRNEPCPCGSGKKYKKCCLNKDTSSS